MTVTRDDVRHVAALARLELSDDEVERFTPQLDAILSHAADLEAADAVDGEPAMSERAAPLAGDAPGADPLLHPPSAMTPAWRDGFFTVPRLAAMQGVDPDDA